MMNLTMLKAGEAGLISHVEGSGPLRARLGELGFVGGETVKKVYAAPSGNPIVFEVLGSKVALRRSEAVQIKLADGNEKPAAKPQPKAPNSFDLTYIPAHKPAPMPAAACSGCAGGGGCPSCGSKAQSEAEREARPGEITLALVGNPNSGKTSLFNAASGGHEHTGNYGGVTVRSVVGRLTLDGRHIRLIDLPGTYSLRAFSPEEAYVAHELETGRIDAVINVLDATNLERNLLLTLQLKERNLPLVGALNMYDELETSGSRLDRQALTTRLGMPLVATVARKNEGVEEVLRAAIELADKRTEAASSQADATTRCITVMPTGAAARQCPCPEREQEDRDRYATIHQLLDGIYSRRQGRAARLTARLDRVLAAGWVGYPLFVAVMGFIFWATFTVGQYPMDWIDQGVAALSDQLRESLPVGMLQDMLVDGVLGGVGSVIVFLPNILILYLLISFLEDSGYLARAALLADPLLNRTGLHGKSFIPLLMGFGCNVPAVMATRTIENHKSRMLTLFVVPLMSCSARLPVYIVFAGAFFTAYAGWVMLALYALGILTALIVAAVMNRIYHLKEETHFVMELPPYRLPTFTAVLRHTWERARQYLQKMGGIILAASLVIWALGYFPRSAEELSPMQQQEQSYIGRLGHAIQPVLDPLGYDWRMSVGILSGVGAKELMVTTLGVLYGCSEEYAEAASAAEASQTRLAQVLQQHTTAPAALSYLVFALIYFPCLATIAAVKGETGRWRHALWVGGYTTALAYMMAFVTYQLALLFL